MASNECTSVPVSTQQKQVIDESIAVYRTTADKLVFYDHVELCITQDLGKQKKWVPRLFACSKYRFFFYQGKNTFSKHTFEKDVHLLHLVEIGGLGTSAFFQFNLPNKGKQYYVIKCARIAVLLKRVQEVYKRISFGWREDVACRVVLSDSEVPNLQKLSCGPAKGLLYTYSAYCNLFESHPNSLFVALIEDIDALGQDAFDFGACPTILNDLNTVSNSLQQNTFFKALEMKNIQHKDAIVYLGLILELNRTVRRISFINCDAEIPESFGNAIQSNAHHQIQVLQLTGNTFSSKSIESFSRSMATFPHILRVLDLSYCGISSQGVISLLSSLRENYRMGLAIEQLSLAGAQMSTSDANQAIIEYLNHAKIAERLQRLSLSNTGISIALTAPSLTTLPLKFLDLSDNKITENPEAALAHFAATTKTLETLSLAGTSIAADITAAVLGVLFRNTSLTSLNLDLSRNNYGPEGANALTAVFPLGQSLRALDLSDNNIRNQAGMELLRSLPPRITRLSLNRNFVGNEAPDIGEAIAGFITTHPLCRSLYLIGGSGYRIGKLMAKFFSLIEPSTIQELDISENNVGDLLFTQLCLSLRLNTTLRSLLCDGNNITASGYLALRQILSRNKTLTHVEFPTVDIKQSKNPTEFRKLVLGIIETLSTRRASTNFTETNPFLFDLNWKTPVTVPAPLLSDNDFSSTYTPYSVTAHITSLSDDTTNFIPHRPSKLVQFAPTAAIVAHPSDSPKIPPLIPKFSPPTTTLTRVASQGQMSPRPKPPVIPPPILKNPHSPNTNLSNSSSSKIPPPPPPQSSKPTNSSISINLPPLPQIPLYSTSGSLSDSGEHDLKGLMENGQPTESELVEEEDAYANVATNSLEESMNMEDDDYKDLLRNQIFPNVNVDSNELGEFES